MTQGIHTLTAAMVNQLNKVDIVSNNLANANTTGFKQEDLTVGTFNHYLENMVATGKKDELLNTSIVMNTIPKNDTKFVDGAVGSIMTTGNNLDFAISEKNGFFKVQISDDEFQLTRNGSFKTIDGFLVNGDGKKVLDNQNKPIDTNQEDWTSKIDIIKSSYYNIEKVGNNNYKVLENGLLSSVENKETILIQGSLEKSNVNQIKTMVDLINAQRKFEQSQKAISSIDAIDKKAIDSVGRVN